MDQKMMFKQMIDFQKMAFDNSFNAISKLQEQGKSVFTNAMNQAPWMPEDGKKAVSEWLEAYKKNCDEFKKNADENFAKVQSFFAEEKK